MPSQMTNFFTILEYLLKDFLKFKQSYSLARKNWWSLSTISYKSKMNRFWDILNLIQLEQIPNAFSVWNKLQELSLTWKILVPSDVDLLFGNVLGILSHYFRLCSLNFTNFCLIFRIRKLCLHRHHRWYVAHYLKKEWLKY